jgi:hypothetical protein
MSARKMPVIGIKLVPEKAVEHVCRQAPYCSKCYSAWVMLYLIGIAEDYGSDPSNRVRTLL